MSTTPASFGGVFSVVREGAFTGTSYDSLSDLIIGHHEGLGETFAVTSSRPKEVNPESDTAPYGEPTSDQLAAFVRYVRDLLLRQTDWVIVRATEVGANVDPEWSSYRQKLRDITEQDTFPEVTWPVKPGT